VVPIGVLPTVVEPRIRATLLLAGSRVSPAVLEEARRAGVPLPVVLRRDDEGNGRQQALGPFDAPAPRRRRCTPTRVGTPASRTSRGTTRPGSSPGTCGEAGDGRSVRAGLAARKCA
jgi:hypothetical protein